MQRVFRPDEEEESEHENFARKAQSKQRAQEKHEKELSTKVTEVIKITLNSAVDSFGAIKENARIRNEQYADTLLKALKLRISHEEYDKHFLKTERRGRNLLRHEERIILKDGVLMRKYYGEDGSVTHNQIIIPKHLVPELLSTLHGKTNKHPGITKMIQECRAKYYFPGLVRNIRAWVTSCPDCIAKKRIDTRQICPKMLSNTEFTTGPEDCLEVDILPNLPSSNGFQHIITLMDVFSRYLLAYPTQDMTARTLHNRCNDTTLLSTDCHTNRQRITIQIKSGQPDSPNARHTDKSRIDKTRANNRHIRRNACLSEDFVKNINGRKTLNVAQICPNRRHELQHKLS